MRCSTAGLRGAARGQTPPVLRSINRASHLSLSPLSLLLGTQAHIQSSHTPGSPCRLHTNERLRTRTRTRTRSCSTMTARSHSTFSLRTPPRYQLSDPGPLPLLPNLAQPRSRSSESAALRTSRADHGANGRAITANSSPPSSPPWSRGVSISRRLSRTLKRFASLRSGASAGRSLEDVPASPLARRTTSVRSPRIESEEDQKFRADWMERESAAAGFFDTRQRREDRLAATRPRPLSLTFVLFPLVRPDLTAMSPL